MSHIMGGSWVKPMISHPVQICDAVRLRLSKWKKRSACSFSLWGDGPPAFSVDGPPAVVKVGKTVRLRLSKWGTVRLWL